VLAPATAATASAGYVTREIWTSAPGFTVASIPLWAPVSEYQTLTQGLVATQTVGTDYGSRIRGYITAPESGTYTFWMTSDDSGEFWLSTDGTPAKRVKVAWSDTWTASQDWTASTAGHVATVTLVAGQQYYFEALQKQGNGLEGLAIGWTKPSDAIKTTASEVVPASVLSPYALTGTPAGYAVREIWSGDYTLATLPTATAATSKQLLSNGLEATDAVGPSYGSRVRALVTPAETGWYTFWLASDDSGVLSLSTDGSATNATSIASVNGWVNARDYGAQAGQQSAWIHLVAGTSYYLEAEQVQGNGGENLSVGWVFSADAATAPATAADPAAATVVPAGVITPYIGTVQ
jgi:hypothetical protein